MIDVQQFVPETLVGDRHSAEAESDLTKRITTENNYRTHVKYLIKDYDRRKYFLEVSSDRGYDLSGGRRKLVSQDDGESMDRDSRNSEGLFVSEVNNPERVFDTNDVKDVRDEMFMYYEALKLLYKVKYIFHRDEWQKFQEYCEENNLSDDLSILHSYVESVPNDEGEREKDQKRFYEEQIKLWEELEIEFTKRVEELRELKELCAENHARFLVKYYQEDDPEIRKSYHDAFMDEDLLKRGHFIPEDIEIKKHSLEGDIKAYIDIARKFNPPIERTREMYVKDNRDYVERIRKDIQKLEDEYQRYLKLKEKIEI